VNYYLVLIGGMILPRRKRARRNYNYYGPTFCQLLCPILPALLNLHNPLFSQLGKQVPRRPLVQATGQGTTERKSNFEVITFQHTSQQELTRVALRKTSLGPYPLLHETYPQPSPPLGFSSRKS
jgi:hypothetical protein